MNPNPTTLREGLPPLPAHMKQLPLDHRGFPVPWFVQWMKDGKACRAGEGAPDFRVLDAVKKDQCLRHPFCWVCGNVMSAHRVFAIGPMCAVNRVTSEPPSHRACAEFAARACPFLIQPRMRRNEKDLPEHAGAPGFALDRNPGVVCLWETNDYKPFDPHAGGAGYLIRLGEKPTRVDWWRQGLPATRAEVLASIDSGMPALVDMAKRDGPAALRDLERQRIKAMELLPS